MHVYQNGDDTDNRNDLNLLKLDAELNIYADDSKQLQKHLKWMQMTQMD